MKKNENLNKFQKAFDRLETAVERRAKDCSTGYLPQGKAPWL